MLDNVAQNAHVLLTRIAQVDEWKLATGMGIFILALCVLVTMITLFEHFRLLPKSRIQYGRTIIVQRPVKRKKK